MNLCWKPVWNQGGRSCGLVAGHEDDEPCRSEFICDRCGGGYHPHSIVYGFASRFTFRCTACSNRFGRVVPVDEKIVQAVTKWREVMDEIGKYEPILEPLVAEEKKRRLEVIQAMFPDGSENHEGTNNYEVWPGWVLKAIIKIDRKIDEAALLAVKEQLVALHGVNADELVRLKPEVSLKPYRNLGQEARRVFDQCLTIKVGSPQLSLGQKDEK